MVLCPRIGSNLFHHSQRRALADTTSVSMENTVGYSKQMISSRYRFNTDTLILHYYQFQVTRVPV